MFTIEFNGLGRREISEGWHPHGLPGLYRLYYVYGGSAYFRDKQLAPGKLYIFTPAHLREWSRAENFDHLFFDFFINPPLLIGDYLELDLSDYPAIKAVCDASSVVFTAENVDKKRTVAKGLLGAILSMVEQIVPLNTVKDERITAALEYIRQHLHEQIDLDTLASVACCSKYWFCKLFAKEVGVTPIKYIRDTKLQFATMLLSRGVSVKEAAERMGFNSVKVFSSNYKSQYGIFPSKVYELRNRSDV